MGMCQKFYVQYKGNLTLHENSTSSLGVYEYVGTRKRCEQCLGVFLKKNSSKIHYAMIVGNDTKVDLPVRLGWWSLVSNCIFSSHFLSKR